MTQLTPAGVLNCGKKRPVQADQRQGDFSKALYMTFPGDAPIVTGC